MAWHIRNAVGLAQEPVTPPPLAPPPTPDAEWVFGYGSLMWNPGFPFIEQKPAHLIGYHRAFCIYSHHYRGRPNTPGLVLGLDSGGSCDGVAFRVAAVDWLDAVTYLNERELIGYAYRPAVVTVEIAGETIDTYTFVADTDHPQYAGDLGLQRSAALIMNAEGIAGLNRDYLINTVQQLEDRGYEEPELRRLMEHIGALTGIIDQGSGI